MKTLNPRLRNLQALFYITISALCSAVAVRYFAQEGHLIPGGFSGLSLLLIQIIEKFTGFEIPFAALYLVLNGISTIIVFRYIGKRFTIFSVIQVVLTSIFTTILPNVQAITDQLLLLSVFGGIINGCAGAIALRVDASTGGTDFIAVYTSMKHNMPTWNYIMFGNVVMLGISGYLFGWEIALFSIFYQFSSMQVIKALHSRYKLMTVQIVTNFPDEVCSSILTSTRHGITKFNVEGGYSKTSKYMLQMVVNAFEVDTIVQQALVVDPHVFVNVFSSKRIVGNYRQKPLD